MVCKSKVHYSKKYERHHLVRKAFIDTYRHSQISNSTLIPTLALTSTPPYCHISIISHIPRQCAYHNQHHYHHACCHYYHHYCYIVTNIIITILPSPCNTTHHPWRPPLAPKIGTGSATPINPSDSAAGNSGIHPKPDQG